MNKKIYLTTAFALLALISIVYALKPTPHQTSAKKIINSPQSSTSTHLGENSVDQNNGLSDNSKLTTENLQNMFEEINLDQIRENPSFIFKDRLNQDNITAIQYDHDLINSKKTGDKIHFQLLEFGINRTGTINKIEQVDHDITRWSGSFESQDPNNNVFSITQSQNDQYALIQIKSEQVHTIAEIKNGLGIVNQTPDQLVNDEILPHS